MAQCHIDTGGGAAASIRRKIEAKPELTVVFTGDSHTWGEGADGWEDALTPPAETGEPRRLPESVPCFVQLFAAWLPKRRPADARTAVFNAGYGCASTKVYLERHWSREVEARRPDIVVLEFAINDWIADRDVSLAAFGENLNRMIDLAVGIGASPILLTPAPILGSQWDNDHYYPDYIGRIRSVAAARPETVLADANLMMERYLSGGDRAQNEAVLFEDIWHVAQKGQELYFTALAESLGMKS